MTKKALSSRALPLLLLPLRLLLTVVKMLAHGVASLAHPLRKKWKRAKRAHRVSLALVGLILLVVAIPVIYLTLRPEQSEAGWFDGSYGYRKKMPLTNSSGSNQTDFQIQATIDTATLITAGKMQADCDDIRFTDISGKVLPYWLEPGTCNTATTLVWFKASSIPTSGTDVYFYYGNPSAATASQADQTFLREMSAATAAWPLDDTTSTQSYSQVVNPTTAIGRNFLPNGTFDSTSDWNLVGGASITNGILRLSANSSLQSQTLGNYARANKAYQVTFTIAEYTSGSIRPYVFGTSGTSRNAVGTYTETIIAGTTNTNIGLNPSSFTGDIDNYSIVELNIPSSATIPTNLLTDGDMEASGTGAWTAVFGATLSKEIGTAYAGSQVLRIAGTGGTNHAAEQSVLTVGSVYRVTGYMRSNGTNSPSVRQGGSIVVSGTTSTSWQPIDTVFVATATNLRLYKGSLTDGYVEFDDIFVTNDTTLRTPELIKDGNMEANGTSAWTTPNNATFTKQTTNPYSGNQVLRVAYTNSSSSRVEQNVLTIGKSYTASVWGRGDGTKVPHINNGSTLLTFGTSSTSWQYLEVSFVATSPAVGLSINTTGGYAEFDNFSVKENLVLDSSMEASGTNDWIVANAAVLSKQTTTPHAGSQVLRIARNGAGSSLGAEQNILNIGKTYRATGFARSDGNTTPGLRNFTTVLWTGSTSTSWQYFDVTFTANDLRFRLTNNDTANNYYVEFDDVSLVEVSPMVGIPTNGVVLGSSSGAGGHLTTAYTFDGTNDLVDTYSPSLNSIFNPSEGTVTGWAKVSGSGVWTDATFRTIVSLQADANNTILVRKTSTNNTLAFQYVAGSTSTSVTTTTSTTGYIFVALTWSKGSDQVKAFLNGTQVGSTQTGMGTWTGNLSSSATNIGRSVNTFWSGQINDVRLYDRALTTDEIAAQYSASSDIQAYTTSNYQGKELLRKYNTGVAIGTVGSEEITPGPIAEWKFDEGQGQTTEDSTSNNLDGTLGTTSGSSTDDPTWLPEDQCVSGKCLRFDGGDFVSVPDGTAIDITGSLTLSSWFKTTSSSNQAIIGKWTGSTGNNNQYWLGLVGQSIRLYFSDNGVSANSYRGKDNAGVKDGQWHHVAVVYTASSASITMYIDGKLVPIDAVGGTIPTALYNSTSPLRIGADSASTPVYFNGSIDESKVYNYARSAAQVQADYNAGAAKLGTQTQTFLSSGLVGYWKMDETSGTSVADSSGNGNTGTLTNMQEAGTADSSGGSTTTLVDTDGTLSAFDDDYNGMILRVTATCGSIAANTDRIISDYVASTKTFTVSLAFAATLNSCQYQILHQTGGKFGNSLAFGKPLTANSDTSGDRMSIAQSPSLAVTNVTLSFWLKTTDLANDRNLIAKTDTFNQGFAVTEYNGIRPYFLGVPIGTLPESSLNSNTWQHIVVTHDGTTGKLYHNGVLFAQLATPFVDDDSGLAINTYTDGRYSGGKKEIDEMRLYNRALSQGEITQLYNYAAPPTVHLNFDENSGTALANKGSSALTASMVNSPTWTDGKYGSALNFNGVNQGVDISDVPTANNASFTVGMWANISTLDSTQRALIGNTGGGQYWRRINSSGGGLIHIDNSDCSGSEFSFNLSNGYFQTGWHHYAFSIAANGAFTVYKDGVVFGTATYNPTAWDFSCATNGFRRIGNYTGSYPWLGAIDDVKIYNYARTQAQIVEDMGSNPAPSVSGNNLPDPIAYYKLDEQQGQTANNSGTGGSGLNGTLGANGSASTDDPTWKTAADCKVNGCSSFDGGDYIEIPDSDSLSFGNEVTDKPFSISGWVKMTDATSFRIFGKGNASPSNLYEYGFFTDTSDRLTFAVYDNDPGNRLRKYTAALTSDQGTWIHLAAVYDGSATANGLSIYKNGVLLSTTNDNSGSYVAMHNQTYKALIGRNYEGGSEYSNGLTDELKIYNVALSPEQIREDMNAGGPVNFGSTATTEAAIITGGAGNPPVAYWNFDENTGTTAGDTSGSNNTGTLTNGPTWTPGKVGPSLNFDGTDDLVTAGPSSSLNVQTHTFSAWILPTSTTGTPIIASNSDNIGVSGLEWGIRVNKLAFAYFDGATRGWYSDTGSDLPLNTWTYATFVWNQSAGTISFYRNGVFSSTVATTTGTIVYNSDTFRIARQPSNNYFRGKIDDVKLYNYVRTPAQIAYDYNRGTPVAHWKLDECQGTTANDSSGNGNNGIINLGAGGVQNAGTCTTSSTAWGNGANGKVESSLSFDGTDDYVSIPYSASYNINTNSSVSFWVKTTNASRPILSNRISTGLYLGTSAGKIFQYNNGATPDNVTGNKTINDGAWHHITYIRSGTTSSFYVDGVLDVSTTQTNLTSNTNAFNIAYDIPNGTYLTGQVDDIRIYNYPLSADQVKQVYNGGAVRFGPTTGTP